MARLAGGLVGAAISSSLALGPGIGFALGSTAAGYLFPDQAPGRNGPRPEAQEVTGATEGSPIKVTYGNVRVSGAVYWKTKLIPTTHTESAGGKGGMGGSQSQTTTTWSVSFFVVFAEAPNSVRRIWLNGKLSYDARDTTGSAAASAAIASQNRTSRITVYDGNESQLPDPLIEAVEGVGNAPAYRGLCGVLFEDLLCADFGNGMPAAIEAELSNGAAIAPPSRITEFSPTVDGTRYIEYKDGIFEKASYAADPSDATRQIQTIDTYNLTGDLIASRTFSGRNANSQTSVTIRFIRGAVELSWMYGSTGDVAARSSWFLRGYGARPAGQSAGLPPGPVKEWKESYNTVLSTHGGLRVGQLYFGLNFDNDDVLGVARYPTASNELFPVTNPDNFFSLAGYTVNDELTLSLGDDGLIYIGSATGGFDNGDHVVVIDLDCEFVRSFKLFIGTQTGGGIVVRNQQLATIDTNALADGLIRLYDINQAVIDANAGIAPLIGSGDHDSGSGQNNLTSIGGGLMIADDGVWTLNPRIGLNPQTLQTVVEDICFRAGLSVGQIDASDLTQIVDGYVINNPMSARSAIEGLQPTFNFDAYESEGKIKFKTRGGASVLTIPAADLGAYEGSAPTAAVERTRQPELDLPQEVAISYADKNQDYELGAQRSRRIITTSINKVHLQSAVVMDSQQAQRVTEIFIQNVWHERNKFNFSLDREYDYLEPTDLVTIPAANGNVLVRIIAKNEGANGVREYETVEDLSAIYSSIEGGNDASQETEQSIDIKGPTNLEIIDMAILRTLDDTPGYYVAAGGYYTAWQGAIVSAAPATEDFVLLLAIVNPSVIGRCTSIFPASDSFAVDIYSRVNVQTYGGGALSSITDSQLLAGLNACAIGNEVCYFGVAVQEADGTYTLSRFLRGRQGTSTEGHGETDRFVLLDPAVMLTVDGELSQTSVLYKFEALSIGNAQAEPTSQTLTLTNGRLLPNPPAHPYAHAESNGDVKGRFMRSARKNIEWLNNIDVPQDETSESYEVDVLDDAGDSLRVISVDDSKVFNYTAAQIFTDFGEFRSEYNMTARMISDRVGRGKAANFTATTGIAVSDYEAAVLSDSPVVGWRLGGDFVSQVEPDLEARKVQDTTKIDFYPSAPFGGTNGSVLIQAGPNSEFGITDTTKLALLNSLITNDEFSISFFFKSPPAGTSSGRFAFISLGVFPSPVSGISFMVYNNLNDATNYTLSCKFSNSAGSETVTGTSTNYRDDAWHHVAVVYDNRGTGGNHETLIYVDNILHKQQTNAHAAGLTINDLGTRKLQFHRGEGDHVTNFTGNTCHFWLWDRVITPAEVADHYTASGL